MVIWYVTEEGLSRGNKVANVDVVEITIGENSYILSEVRGVLRIEAHNRVMEPLLVSPGGGSNSILVKQGPIYNERED